MMILKATTCQLVLLLIGMIIASLRGFMRISVGSPLHLLESIYPVLNELLSRRKHCVG